MRLEFEFIQVAMGLRERLSAVPSVHEWQVLFEFCKRQSLLGIGFAAVEKLHEVGVECPADIRLQWYGYALKIERMNEKLNMQCVEITKQYEHDGLQCCILKGQGNLLNYPEGLSIRRMPGDIDVWATPIKYLIHTENTEGHGCPKADDVGERESSEFKQNLNGCPQADDGGEQELINDDRLFTHNIFSAVFIKLRKFLITDGVHTENTDGYGGPQADGGIKIAVQTGKNKVEYHGHKAIREYVRMQYRLHGIDAKPKVYYHHIEAPSMDGTEVEVHYRPAFLRSPLRNWRMQRWFEHHTDECMKNKTHLGFSMMTSSVNVVYQMCHLYTHVFEGGVGLRQLMDYYFALRVWHNDVMGCKDVQTKEMWNEGLGTPVMSKEEVMAVIRSFGMGKFAGAVMWVLNEVFGGANENDNENENGPRRTRREADGGPQADGGGEQQLSEIGQQLKEKIVFAPWMICEPNEKEGKKLLEEIMKGGNFGQYDTRDAALKKGGMMKHGIWKLKRVMRLVRSYPEEALWEPVFRVWHLGWRLMND
ncbi:nucleotidyltransferase family protein [Prevotella sp. P3-122]|uniref:nucleotidyltransferase family protein n=1 Tax=Prevotella sp. P3-122 TaxID=2024223 RepID=UPI000B967205|nr:nucleotidyltransferase family protein [Prevotella sp. P3-122]OYP63671.1 hypothetical protein CIL02_01160 [Prevotella sp. P3-122]